MLPANERQRHIVMLSLIGWAHTQNDPWLFGMGAFRGSFNLHFQFVFWWKLFNWNTNVVNVFINIDIRVGLN